MVVSGYIKITRIVKRVNFSPR